MFSFHVNICCSLKQRQRTRSRFTHNFTNGNLFGMEGSSGRNNTLCAYWICVACIIFASYMKSRLSLHLVGSLRVFPLSLQHYFIYLNSVEKWELKIGDKTNEKKKKKKTID